MMVKMIDEADKAQNTFYNIDPMSAPICWYAGVANFALNNLKEAKINFEKAYTIHPYHIHVINNLASCYEKLNDHKKAIELYNEALKISPDFEETILNLSGSYYNSGDFEKAYLTIRKCSENCTDVKYLVFLHAILSKEIDIFTVNQKDSIIINKLLAIKNDQNKLVSIYNESKDRNIEFLDYLNNKLLKPIK